MTVDPFLRRHGHGVARLAIGSIDGGPSLGRLAGRPVDLEGLIAGLPGLACALAALLLGWNLSSIHRADEPHPAPVANRTADESPLTIRVWQEVRPSSVAAIQRPSIADVAPTPEPGSADVPATPVAPAKPTPVATPSPPSRPSSHTPSRAFDPRSLALQPARAATLPGMSAPLPPADRASKNVSERPIAAQAARAPSDLRQGFLASIARTESLPSPADPEAAARTPRPPVSAPAHDAGLADSIRSGLERWDEVPLDDLPDCTPSGRQDALKQQILRIVPSFNGACSHPEGRYRFVQTRNLNAFLMWSRPNPDAPARLKRDRDACDVLERALRCLGDASNEELSIQ